MLKWGERSVLDSRQESSLVCDPFLRVWPPATRETNEHLDQETPTTGFPAHLTRNFSKTFNIFTKAGWVTLITVSVKQYPAKKKTKQFLNQTMIEMDFN